MGDWHFTIPYAMDAGIYGGDGNTDAVHVLRDAAATDDGSRRTRTTTPPRTAAPPTARRRLTAPAYLRPMLNSRLIGS